jgi:hypothetical protein
MGIKLNMPYRRSFSYPFFRSSVLLTLATLLLMILITTQSEAQTLGATCTIEGVAVDYPDDWTVRELSPPPIEVRPVADFRSPDTRAIVEIIVQDLPVRAGGWSLEDYVDVGRRVIEIDPMNQVRGEGPLESNVVNSLEKYYIKYTDNQQTNVWVFAVINDRGYILAYGANSDYNSRYEDIAADMAFSFREGGFGDDCNPSRSGGGFDRFG